MVAAVSSRASRFDFVAGLVFSFYGTRNKSRAYVRVNGLPGRFAPISLCQQDIMSITVQLDLPDALVNEARANGLLNSAPLGDLLATELRRRKAAAELNNILAGVRAQPGEPMSEADIAAEIKAARKERRAREAGR